MRSSRAGKEEGDHTMPQSSRMRHVCDWPAYQIGHARYGANTLLPRKLERRLMLRETTDWGHGTQAWLQKTIGPTISAIFSITARMGPRLQWYRASRRLAYGRTPPISNHEEMAEIGKTVWSNLILNAPQSGHRGKPRSAAGQGVCVAAYPDRELDRHPGQQRLAWGP